MKVGENFGIRAAICRYQRQWYADPEDVSDVESAIYSWLYIVLETACQVSTEG